MNGGAMTFRKFAVRRTWQRHCPALGRTKIKHFLTVSPVSFLNSGLWSPDQLTIVVNSARRPLVFTIKPMESGATVLPGWRAYVTQLVR